MFLANRNILLKSFKLTSKNNIANQSFLKLLLRNFGTHAVHHDGHNESSGHGDHGHEDHGHGHGHGHHEITGEVDLHKVFVPMNSNRVKLVALTGLPSTSKLDEGIIEGNAKAKAAITPISIPFITRNRVFHQDLANVSYEENPYFHPEPYGYLINDDVI